MVVRKVSLQTTKDSKETFHVLDETADFLLLVGPKQMEPQKGLRCYLLYNRQTGVFEAEGTGEAYSRLALKDAQTSLDKVKSGQFDEEDDTVPEMPPMLLQ